MGAADVVPGVSGGTIAFISGIYEELIDSLRSITPATLALLWRKGPAALWRAINGNFLLTLFGGVFISLMSLSRLISYALEYYPILVWCFFFGLITGSIVYMLRQIKGWRWQQCLALGIGVLIALAVSVARPAQLPDEWWMVFAAGSIAICAMILPGISGSFILLLMGMYSVFLNALKNLDLLLLGSFFGGCVCGLLAFSHLLGWLLQRFHSVTIALLTGFLAGSLNVIWPWKQTLESMLNRHGELVPLVQENLSPWAYTLQQQQPSYLLPGLLLMFVGLALVLALEYLVADSRPDSDSI